MSLNGLYNRFYSTEELFKKGGALKSVTSRGDVLIPKEHLSAVFPVKVYLAKENRQTWGGSWDYWRNSAWHLSLGDAQSFCERNRVQGSHWKIIELPAVVFLGVKNALVCGQLAAIPLGAFTELRAESLQEAKDQIDAQVKSIPAHWFLVSGDIPGTIRFPFLLHESASVGGQQRLGWSSVVSPQRVEGVLRLSTHQMLILNKEIKG